MNLDQNQKEYSKQDKITRSIAAAEYTIEDGMGQMPPELSFSSRSKEDLEVAEVINNTNNSESENNGESEDSTNPEYASRLNNNQESENAQADQGSQEEQVLSDGAEQLLYEIVAHFYAYNDSLSENQANLLEQLGYFSTWDDSNIINDQDESGLFAVLILPNAAGLQKGRRAILAFRGSEKGDQLMKDWSQNDMDPYAVGYTAFMMNYARIESFLIAGQSQSGNYVSAVGHSLGGALAKQAAIHFPQHIGKCVTFQAPGIALDQQNALEENDGQNVNVLGEDTGDRGVHDVEFVNHISRGDMVHWTGDGRIPNAETIQHNPSDLDKNIIHEAHMNFLLSDDKYTSEQEELFSDLEGVNNLDDVLNIVSENAEGELEGDGAQQFESDENSEAWWEFSSLGSWATGLIGDNLHPNAHIINDNANNSEDGIARISEMPIGARINLMREFMSKPSILESFAKGAAPAGAIGGAAGGAIGGIAGGLTGAIVGFALGGPIGAVAGAAIGSTAGVAAGAMTGALVGGMIGGVSLSLFIETNDTQNTKQAMVHILNASTAREKVEIIHSIGGLNAIIDRIGKDYSGFYSCITGNSGYFSALFNGEAAGIIAMNLEPNFFGFGGKQQEEIIVDCLLNCPDPERVIATIGNGEFDDGLEKILRRLHGEQNRIIGDKFLFNRDLV